MTGIAFQHHHLYPHRPTLIFLHDSLGCIELWRDFPERLGKALKMNIFVYDRLGYGKSDPFAYDVRPLDYMEKEADMLAEIIQLHDIQKPILFGHSDGASIALIAAGKYPHLIKGIVLEGAHIFVEDITLKGINDATEAYKTTNLKEKLEKYHGNNTDALFWAWSKTWNRPDFRDWNIEHFLPQIICPTLVLQGETDEYGTLEQVYGIERAVKGPYEFHYMEQIGHNPHKQSPEDTLEIVSAFLSQYF